VLETGEYIRVGGTQIRRTDVRIVAATNINFRKAISEGRFREDLYYRLLQASIQRPALRDRGQDIILLFRHFALEIAEKHRFPKITLTDEAKSLMLRYKWPGNIRQLKNITEQMSVLSENREIDAQTLRRFIPEDPESTELAPIAPSGSHTYENERELLYKILYELKGNVSDLRRDMNSLRKQLDEARQLGGAAAFGGMAAYPADTTAVSTLGKNVPTQENKVEEADAEEIREPESLNLSDLSRQMLEKALERNGGNRKKAAQELGISDRTLYRRLRQYGLDNK
jgi:DNA-binding NtrC family response regulator